MKPNRPVLSPALALALLCASLLAGCGGSSSSDSGTTRVNVSLASSGINGAAPASLAPEALRPAGDPLPDHAWITVTGVALLPADGSPCCPDPDGEPAVHDGSSRADGGSLSTTLPSPAEVDLLALPSGGAALFLDAIDSVPAGTYRKLRLFYTDPKVHFPGDPDNTAVHATANYHVDLHFTGGGLAVPVATDGDVRIVNVTVNFVLGSEGLKITVNPGKILMRPQVFCTVDALKYMVRGTADNVDATLASFDLLTGTGRSFPVLWGGGTAWSWVDNGTVPSRSVAVASGAGAGSLRATAFVTGVGAFEGGRFLAEWLAVTFPSVRTGPVLLSWSAEDTFVLGSTADNATVYPLPSRAGARYDDLASLAPLPGGDLLVLPGVPATVRGYATPAGIDAYWISLGTP